MNVYKVRGRSESWEEGYYETYIVVAEDAGEAESIVAKHESRPNKEEFCSASVVTIGRETKHAACDGGILFDLEKEN